MWTASGRYSVRMTLDLAEVRRTVEALGKPTATIPFEALLQAATAARGHHVTLDLEATRTLGFPLVVVREAMPPRFFEKLSPREREVALLLARGRCNKDIAHDLGIAVGTVKDHVHAVLSKSGLSSRLEVVSAFISSAS